MGLGRPEPEVGQDLLDDFGFLDEGDDEGAAGGHGGRYRAREPFFEQVMVIGEGNPFLQYPGYAQIRRVAVFSEPWSIESRGCSESQAAAYPSWRGIGEQRRFEETGHRGDTDENGAGDEPCYLIQRGSSEWA